MNRNTKAQIKLFKEMQRDYKNTYEFFIDQTLPEKSLGHAEMQLKKKLQKQRRRFFDNLRAIDPERLQDGEVVKYQGSYWLFNHYKGNHHAILYSNGNKTAAPLDEIERMD